MALSVFDSEEDHNFPGDMSSWAAWQTGLNDFLQPSISDRQHQSKMGSEERTARGNWQRPLQ